MISEHLSDWVTTYSVSVDDYQDIELSVEAWGKLAGGYFKARTLAPRPMSFSSMFGDDMNAGYDPGTEQNPRFLRV